MNDGPSPSVEGTKGLLVYIVATRYMQFESGRGGGVCAGWGLALKCQGTQSVLWTNGRNM